MARLGCAKISSRFQIPDFSIWNLEFEIWNLEFT